MSDELLYLVAEVNKNDGVDQTTSQGKGKDGSYRKQHYSLTSLLVFAEKISLSSHSAASIVERAESGLPINPPAPIQQHIATSILHADEKELLQLIQQTKNDDKLTNISVTNHPQLSPTQSTQIQPRLSPPSAVKLPLQQKQHHVTRHQSQQQHELTLNLNFDFSSDDEEG